MIVVNRGRRQLGHQVEVIIDSVLQSSAGRMAFADMVNGAVQKPAPELASVKLAS